MTLEIEEYEDEGRHYVMIQDDSGKIFVSRTDNLDKISHLKNAFAQYLEQNYNMIFTKK